MKINKPVLSRSKRSHAFTIIEVLVAFAVGGLMIAGMVQGYQLAARRTEYAAYSQAAQAQALKQMELAMTASLRPDSGVDQLVTANFPTNLDYLCMPVSETNLISCTNVIKITTLAGVPTLKMIQVDCVWTINTFASTNTRHLFTNTVVTIHGPNIGQ